MSGMNNRFDTGVETGLRAHDRLLPAAPGGAVKFQLRGRRHGSSFIIFLLQSVWF